MNAEYAKEQAKAEAFKHAVKNENKDVQTFHVTMPDEACFMDLDKEKQSNLSAHAVERKLSIFTFTRADLFDDFEEVTPQLEEGKAKRKK